MQMQVDARDAFAFPLKRQRSDSPSSGSPIEDLSARPTKRPTLRLTALIGASSRSNSVAEPALRTEDWVSRTGGLHLDSPQPTPADAFSSHGNSTAPSEADHDPYIDEDDKMTGDFEHSGSRTNLADGSSVSLFISPPSNVGSSSIRDSESESIWLTDGPKRHHTTPPVLSVVTDQLAPNPPQINILPATPSSITGGLSVPASPMAISPSSAGSWSPSSPTRRAKLVMGPRSDCQKCREGVKGHWIHYN